VQTKDTDKLNFTKLPYDGKVKVARQFSPLPLLPLKMTLTSKVVKSD